MPKSMHASGPKASDEARSTLSISNGEMTARTRWPISEPEEAPDAVSFLRTVSTSPALGMLKLTDPANTEFSKGKASIHFSDSASVSLMGGRKASRPKR